MTLFLLAIGASIGSLHFVYLGTVIIIEAVISWKIRGLSKRVVQRYLKDLGIPYTLLFRNAVGDLKTMRSRARGYSRQVPKNAGRNSFLSDIGVGSSGIVVGGFVLYIGSVYFPQWRFVFWIFSLIAVVMILSLRPWGLWSDLSKLQSEGDVET